MGDVWEWDFRQGLSSGTCWLYDLSSYPLSLSFFIYKVDTRVKRLV